MPTISVDIHPSIDAGTQIPRRSDAIGRQIVAGFALAILVGLGGCKSKGPPSAQLFSDAEIATFRAELDARLATTAKQACRAGADLAAIIEPGKAPHAACVEQVVQFVRNLPPSETPNELLEKHVPDAVALDEVCGPTLEALVVAAADHAETCAPYQTGVRVTPDLLGALATWKFLSYRAKWIVERGDRERGTTLLLALLRTAQDLGRGRTQLMPAMISIAEVGIIADRLDAILAALEPIQLDRIATALDRALADVPRFTDLMAGERDLLEVAYAMGALDPAWIPPGGIPVERAAVTPTANAAPRDEAGILFASTAARDVRIQRACPASATLAMCHNTFARQSKVTAPAIAEAEWERLANADADELDAVRRQVLTNLLEGMEAHDVAFADHVGAIAQEVARLAVLRAHVEVRRTGKCEVPDAIRSPVRLGMALPFEVTGDRIVMKPPPWVGGKAYEFSCRE